MSYFLSKNKLAISQLAELSPDELRHLLLSRRIKPGEHVFIQDPELHRFEAEIVTVSKKGVGPNIIKPANIPAEPALKVALFQAMISEKALDFIFQKGTELGAAEIVLFNSAHTAAKLSAAIFRKKQERWNKILWEAAKQSDRGKPPELKFYPSLAEACRAAENYQSVIVLDPSGNKRLKDVKPTQISSAAIVTGPEGGFTPEEVEQLKSLPSADVYSLGPILLKAETDALASLAALTNL